MDVNTRIVLTSRPSGAVSPGNFTLEREELPTVSEGEVLLRTIYLSIDPYMRGRMNASKSYAPRVELGEVMEGGAVSEVLRSESSSLIPGDIVFGQTGWQAYSAVRADQVRRLDHTHRPISTALGILGMPSFAAYLGIFEIARPRQGETFVVAAASGPVGSVAGQLAQLEGARVVGIAGGREKTEWLEKVGFDISLDHRSSSFSEDLIRATPDGIDIYFENVGGHIWDQVFPRLNDFARVPVCGLIANYNIEGELQGSYSAADLMTAINTKRLMVQGFTQRDYRATHYEEFLSRMLDWFKKGLFSYREQLYYGIESAPTALIDMLSGSSFGKVIVQVGDDPTR